MPAGGLEGLQRQPVLTLPRGTSRFSSHPPRRLQFFDVSRPKSFNLATPNATCLLDEPWHATAAPTAADDRSSLATLLRAPIGSHRKREHIVLG